MTKYRYVVWSVASGFCWGLLALLVISALDLELRKTWGGVAAAPLIGLAVGAIFRRTHTWRPGWRVVAYVVSLYLAVALFGLAASIPPVVSSSSSSPISDVLAAPVAFVVGITIYPLWVIFIPLAIMNNYLLGLIDKKQNHQIGGAGDSATNVTS